MSPAAAGSWGGGARRRDRGDPAVVDVNVLSLVDPALAGLRYHQHRDVLNQHA
jgi:hypothetical protein